VEIFPNIDDLNITSQYLLSRENCTCNEILYNSYRYSIKWEKEMNIFEKF